MRVKETTWFTLALVLLLTGGSSLINSFWFHPWAGQHWGGSAWGRLGTLYAPHLFSLVVVGALLAVVGKAPWFADFSLALKRTIIGTLPAAMSATVTDAIT